MSEKKFINLYAIFVKNNLNLVSPNLALLTVWTTSDPFSYSLISLSINSGGLEDLSPYK